MNTLIELSKTDPENVTRCDILAMFNCKSSELNNTLADAFNACTDIGLLKVIAIVHNGYEYQYSLEDILIEKMGEDEYWEFAEEHDL